MYALRVLLLSRSLRAAASDLSKAALGEIVCEPLFLKLSTLCFLLSGLVVTEVRWPGVTTTISSLERDEFRRLGSAVKEGNLTARLESSVTIFAVLVLPSSPVRHFVFCFFPLLSYESLSSFVASASFSVSFVSEVFEFSLFWERGSSRLGLVIFLICFLASLIFSGGSLASKGGLRSNLLSKAVVSVELLFCKVSVWLENN